MPLELSRIQALCFDVDGTLRDTDDMYVARVSKLLRPFRFLLPNKDFQTAARRLVMGLESPAHLFYSFLDWLTIDDEIVGVGDWLHDRGILKSKREFLTIPGIPESLASLAKKFPSAVVSARGERGTMAFLEHSGLLKYFKCVASGQTAPRTKPWADPVLWAAEQMGVPPENCLMIGDTTVDIRAGRAAGAQTAGVLSGFGREKELRKVQAHIILESVAHLPSVLFK